MLNSSAWPNSVSNQSYWLLNILPLLSKPSPYISQLSAQNLPKMKVVQLLCFEFFVKISEYTNNFRHSFSMPYTFSDSQAVLSGTMDDFLKEVFERNIMLDNLIMEEMLANSTTEPFIFMRFDRK